MTYMKAVEAGCDVIDTALSPFALGTSQPATEVMYETLKAGRIRRVAQRRCPVYSLGILQGYKKKSGAGRADRYKDDGRRYEDTAVSGAGRNAVELSTCR